MPKCNMCNVDMLVHVVFSESLSALRIAQFIIGIYPMTISFSPCKRKFLYEKKNDFAFYVLRHTVRVSLVRIPYVCNGVRFKFI